MKWFNWISSFCSKTIQYPNTRVRIPHLAKYVSFFIIVYALLFVNYNSLAFALGEQTGCSLWPTQRWYFVDSSKPFRTIKGMISRTIKLNVGLPYINDGDWQIYVDPNDKSVLTNSRNNTNSTGEIELEINSKGMPNDLASYFSKGVLVEAHGEWVEDQGHDPKGGYNARGLGGKTELHPLYWMRTLDKNPAVIYVAQDDTGRFVNSQNQLWREFSFILPGQYPLVAPGSIPPSRTQIIHESARISYGKTARNISPTGYNLSVYLDDWYFNDCEFYESTIGTAFSPLYFGTIGRTVEPLMKETLTYTVGTDISTNLKIASLKVKIELKSPPQGNIVHSIWEYESSAGVTGVVREVKTSPPHNLKFIMPYCPALGFNQSQWRVSVSGSTVPFDQAIPQSSNSSITGVTRTSVTEGRTYHLEPSKISLNTEEKGSGVCPDVVYLKIEQSKLLPQIKLRKVKWFLKKIKDSDGFTVNNPEAIEVTYTTPIDDPGYSARTYSKTVSDPHRDKRFDVIWKKLPGGSPNLSQIVVTARGVTELGENVNSSIFLSPLCGIPPYSYNQILDYSSRLLASKGLGGEPYKVLKTADSAEQSWIKALARYKFGEKISTNEKKLILNMARKGAALPTLPAQKKLKPVDLTKYLIEPATPTLIPLRK